MAETSREIAAFKMPGNLSLPHDYVEVHNDSRMRVWICSLTANTWYMTSKHWNKKRVKRKTSISADSLNEYLENDSKGCGVDNGSGSSSLYITRCYFWEVCYGNLPKWYGYTSVHLFPVLWSNQGLGPPPAWCVTIAKHNRRDHRHKKLPHRHRHRVWRAVITLFLSNSNSGTGCATRLKFALFFKLTEIVHRRQ